MQGCVGGGQQQGEWVWAWGESGTPRSLVTSEYSGDQRSEGFGGALQVLLQAYTKAHDGTLVGVNGVCTRICFFWRSFWELATKMSTKKTLDPGRAAARARCCPVCAAPR
jgi:hypothetical protein